MRWITFSATREGIGITMPTARLFPRHPSALRQAAPAWAPPPHALRGADGAGAARAAEPYRAAIEKSLNDTVLPGLTGSIVTSKIMTPVDFGERYLSMHGAGFGMEPRLTQSAWFRPHNKSEEVANLFLVGAGTHPGAGVPGVLSSARVLDEVVPDASVWR